MSENVFAESILIALAVILFLGALVAAMAVLSYLRRRRVNHSSHLPEAQTPFNTPSLPPTFVQPLPTPTLPADASRLASRESALPSALPTLNFTIEPDSAPTAHERNVHRLIAFLKGSSADHV